jgi:DDE superfamily endonuclease
MMLYRILYPCRIRPEMENRFKASPTRISYIVKKFIRAFYQLSMNYFTDVTMWPQYVPQFAALIRGKVQNLWRINVWGFVDGTIRQTCRPTMYQRAMYSGHKKIHGFKYQSIYLPNSMYGHIYGPVLGSRRDSYMWDVSGIRPQLEQMFPRHEFQLYGDSAYASSGFFIAALQYR